MPLLYIEIDNFSIHYIIKTSRARAQQREGHHGDCRAGHWWEVTVRAAALGLAERQVTPHVPLSIPYRPQGQPHGPEQGVVPKGGCCLSFTSFTLFSEPSTKGLLDIMAVACGCFWFSRLNPSLSKQRAAVLALAPAELSSLLRQRVLAGACQAQVGTGQ